MIEETPIVQDTRRIRCLISKQFNDDLDQYIDYLKSQESVSFEKKRHVKESSLQKESVQQ